MSRSYMYADPVTGQARLVSAEEYDPVAALEWNKYLVEAEKALADPHADLTDPRYMERLTIKALRLYGRLKIADALARKGGRLPKGAISRAEAIDTLSGHDDPVLRHAATLLPKQRKERNPKVRVQSARIPGWEIARLVRARLSVDPVKNRAFIAVAEALGPDYSPEYVKNTWHKLDASTKNK